MQFAYFHLHYKYRVINEITKSKIEGFNHAQHLMHNNFHI